MKHLRNVLCVAAWLWTLGCESAGEKIRGVNWEMKAEKQELAPHEEHRQLLEDLARPR